MTHASKLSLVENSSLARSSKVLDGHRWAVRIFPRGELLASGLHHAEAEGFARAWNRIEGDEALRACVIVDREATDRAVTDRSATRPKRRSKAG